MSPEIFDFKISLAIRTELIQKFLGPKFQFLGMGKDRITYLSPNKRYVLKFPKCDSGLEANAFESKIWRKYRNGGHEGAKYAPCRLLKNGVLMMWTVQDISGCTHGCDSGRKLLGGRNCYDYDADDGCSPKQEARLPDWVYSIDCCQVGYLSSNGKLVAYDFGG